MKNYLVLKWKLIVENVYLLNGKYGQISKKWLK